MAKYKYIDNGVQDTETGASIPNDPANRHWQEYLVWTTVSGNETDPQYTAQEIEDNMWAEIRGERNRLLTDSDWTQLADSPLSDPDKAEWTVYRQDLRDIPQDYPTGSGIVWPDAPTYSGTS